MGTPYLASDYREAFKIRRKLENEMAWIQGMYFYDAVAVCLQNVLRKRGAKHTNYLERPIDIFPLTAKEKKQREREEMIKTQKELQSLMKAQIARKKQSEIKKQRGDE